jgi:hypothetical protein
MCKKQILTVLLNCAPTRDFSRVPKWFVFQTKNPNLGKYGRALQWKLLVYFMATWSILRSFGIFWGHLVYSMVIWYIFFGVVHKEESGNPGFQCTRLGSDLRIIHDMASPSLRLEFTGREIEFKQGAILRLLNLQL